MALLSVLNHISPKGHPLISNLQTKLEAFLLLLKLSTVPILLPSPPETSHPFCGHPFIEEPQTCLFQGISVSIPAPSPFLNIDCKIPQVLQEPSVFLCKKPEETTASRRARVPAGPSQPVGGGWREEENHSLWCCLYCALTARPSGAVWRAAFTRP